MHSQAPRTPLRARAIRAAIKGARIGASNWVEVVGHSGDLSPNASDAFQYEFYSALRDADVPIDWISVSHYGGGLRSSGIGNFPGADYVQRTPHGNEGQVELLANCLTDSIVLSDEYSEDVAQWRCVSSSCYHVEMCSAILTDNTPPERGANERPRFKSSLWVQP